VVLRRWPSIYCLVDRRCCDKDLAIIFMTGRLSDVRTQNGCNVKIADSTSSTKNISELFKQDLKMLLSGLGLRLQHDGFGF
jgi:hypothetical protein